ncbi:MAG: hypothetical protein WA477_10110 [Candidatus Sulfotelmatobacter sp.]
MSARSTVENRFDLREVTERLRHLLDSLPPLSAADSLPERIVTPRQMSALLSELTLAGAMLRSLPEPKGTEFAEELSEYRQEVERLRALLPSLQAALLRERARLEQQRERVQNTEEWARTSGQTL